MVGFQGIWRPSFETGIEQIDKHHMTLVQLIVDLKNAHEEHRDAEFANVVVEALRSYAKYHFLAEERIMVSAKYPYIEEHRKEHAFFTEKVNEDFMTTPKGAPSIAMELLDFLKEWLIDHILVKDRNFADFFHAGR